MTNDVLVHVDGCPVRVPAGTPVAVACAQAGAPDGRLSASGQRRHAFCGMGVCGECRVTVDGRPHRLGCQVACLEGMRITRDAG